MHPKTYNKHFRSPKKNQDGLLHANTPTETIHTYLNKRLREIGGKHVMAIPGDYIAEWVETLDVPELSAGLIRVHPNNEMCAAYAADGYGRAANGNTVGCVTFTYGVGALNAIQAVAGAHVEHVPLVAVNGSPSPAQFNSQRDQGVLWHHMFDGTHTDLKIFSEITEMAVRIDNPSYAPDLIDAALTACITSSRPVYIEIANTIGGLPCQEVSARPKLQKSPVAQDEEALTDAANYIMDIMKNAKRLVIMGGVEVARQNKQDDFKKLIQLIQAPYVSSLLGKSLLSEFDTDINFCGVYNGRNSQENVQQLFENSPEGNATLLQFGVLETDFNFAGITSVDYDPSSEVELPLFGTVEMRNGAVLISDRASANQDANVYWGNVRLDALIDKLIELMTASGKLPYAPYKGLASGTPWDIPNSDNYKATDQITWDSFKSLLQHDYLDTFDTDKAPVVLADTGLTFYSLNNIKVPQNGFIAQLAWGAIGYSPAASYGVKLALEDSGDDRQVVSISGDGAISESINCLGTIAELGQNNVVFAMANGVFAIEQFLINAQAFSDKPDAPKFTALTQVPQTSLWDWKKIAEGFGGIGYEVTSNEELSATLAEIRKNSASPTIPSGPCADKSSTGCCEFHASDEPVRRSTFTLVAVRNVCKDLPSNTKWKLR
jgi:TPP-dependent 2-oxoacid decarboxylase